MGNEGDYPERTQNPPEGEEDTRLCLNGICRENVQRTGNYSSYGEPGEDPQGQRQPDPSGERRQEQGGGPAADVPPADADVPGRTRVTLKRGDTFWKLAEEKYNGKHPIEAIYALNGLAPQWVEKNGKRELVDPTYYAGKTYVLPAPNEIEALTQKYKQQVKELGQNSQERVGPPNQSTEVKLVYGDTFWKLGQAKYGKERPPIEAIYEANKLTPKVVESNGKVELKDPIYYAGRSYVLPAAEEVNGLLKSFWERMGHPERYRPWTPDATESGAGPNQNQRRPEPGNYNQYGEPDGQSQDANQPRPRRQYRRPATDNQGQTRVQPQDQQTRVEPQGEPRRGAEGVRVEPQTMRSAQPNAADDEAERRYKELLRQTTS